MTNSTYRLRALYEGLGVRMGRWQVAVPQLAIIGALLVLVGTAVVIARGDATQQMAEDAQTVTWSESVMSSASALQAEVREGLIVGQSVTNGVFAQEEAGLAAERIVAAADELVSRAQILDGVEGDSSVTATARSLSGQAADVADKLASGDVTSATELAEGVFTSQFGTLVDQVDRVRRDGSQRIANAAEGSGTVGTAARYLAGLIIPVLAIFLVFRAMRKSQSESLLRTELARERELRRKKGAFLAAASHHIKTPLASVVGFAELLRDRTNDFNAGVRHEVTDLLATQAGEVSHVVDDLLVAARYDLGELTLLEEPVEIRDVISEAIDDWATTQRARLTVTGSGSTVADTRWLGHALRNILRNAAAFGGENIRVNVQEVFRKVVIEIGDDGSPIPNEARERIFELYYSFEQIEGLAPSLGLGLAVARRVARTMGGDLQYHRLDGENVFELSIPKAGDTSRAELIPSRTIDPEEGRPTQQVIQAIIEQGGPDIVYQPIVDMQFHGDEMERVLGYEALARFDGATPVEWFETASRVGLRQDLELVCVSSAVAGFEPDDVEVFLSVNVSDTTLQSSRLQDALGGFDPVRVVLELSEGSSIRSYESTRRVVESLADHGSRLAIDGVGKAEVDLWQLSRLGAQVIKIDAALVSELVASPRHRAIIRGITTMANDLGVLVVAEGVETEVEHELLIELGVRLGQGYLYGKPRPEPRIEGRSWGTGEASDLRG